MAATAIGHAHPLARQGGDQGARVAAWTGLTTPRGWDAFLLGMIGLAAAAYAIGLLRLTRRTGGHAAATKSRAAWFACGLVALLVTLLGPLDAWADRSFALHMIQHELLMLMVAPLLVLGRPLALWAWALPVRTRHHLRRALSAWRDVGVWRLATGAAGACALQAAALWLWHLPAWFRAALEHPGVHVLQHTTFLATALCFWWSVLRPAPARLAAPAAIASLFFTTLTSGALGALLTFAPSPWYAEAVSAPPFGMTPIEDQQIGGLVMWIPGCLLYVVAALVLGARVLGVDERPGRVHASAAVADAARQRGTIAT
jgi:putative membrane protein